MTQHVGLYCDEGAGAFSLFSCRDYFSSSKVTILTADDIIRNGIPNQIDIFVMPGGADRPYAKKLNGVGNKNIRHYVQQGGTYLGICAGAYYGCSTIEFQKGTSGEICENRELEFHKETAVGCLNDIAKPYDLSLKSAAITSISIQGQTREIFYWGGCHLGFQETADSQILARYEAVKNNPAAIISRSIGQGRAILSGVHFEVSAEALKVFNFENEDDNNLKVQLAKGLENKERINFDHLINKTERQAA